MQRVFFRPLPASAQPFYLDIDSSKSIGDVQKLIGARESLDPTSVRLVWRSKVLDKSALISTVHATDSSPIIYYGKKLTASQDAAPPVPPIPSVPPPAPPPTRTAQPAPLPQVPYAAPPPPAPITSPPPAPITSPLPQSLARTAQPATGTSQAPAAADPDAVERLREMGFAEDQARLALQYARNDAELAANILGEGNGQVPDDIARRSTQQKVTVTNAGMYSLLSSACARPEIVQRLLSGQTVDFRLAQTLVPLTRADIDGWLTAIYGMDFPTFIRTGGFERHGPPGEPILQPIQGRLDEVWGKQFAQLPPFDQANIQRIGEQAGADVSISTQIYMLADMSLDQALILARRITPQ